MPPDSVITEGTTNKKHGSGSVHVLFFSVLRQRLGKREMDVVIDGPTSARDFLSTLTEMVPEVAEFASTIRFAVNLEYSGPDTIIRQGDEVAVITPVSGG